MSTFHEKYKNITSLTPNAIKTILEPEKIFYIVQIYEKSQVNAQNYVRIKISDGNTRYTVLLADNAYKKAIKYDLKEKAVIKIDMKHTLVSSQQETAQAYKPVLITDFELIYANVGVIVGHPMSFSEFQKNNYVNERGSVHLPREFLNLLPESSESSGSNTNQQVPSPLHRLIEKKKSPRLQNIIVEKSQASQSDIIFGASPKLFDFESQQERAQPSLIAQLKGNNEKPRRTEKQIQTPKISAFRGFDKGLDEYLPPSDATRTPREMSFGPGQPLPEQSTTPRRLPSVEEKKEKKVEKHKSTPAPERRILFEEDKEQMTERKETPQKASAYHEGKHGIIATTKEKPPEPHTTSPQPFKFSIREFYTKNTSPIKPLKTYFLKEPPKKTSFNLISDLSSMRRVSASTLQPPFQTTTSTGRRTPFILPAEERITSWSNDEFTPVKTLVSHMENWIIKVRVTLKSEVREYRMKSGQSGRVFSVDLLDSANGEIQMSFFDTLCHRFYDEIKEGDVYCISGGKIKASEHRVTGSTHSFGIIADESTTVKSLPDDGSIPANSFQFTHLNEIKRIEKGNFVDVAAFVSYAGPLEFIEKRNTGAIVKKRTLLLTVDHRESYELVCWGSRAETLNLTKGDIIIIKRARVGEFNGEKQLTFSYNTNIITKDLHKFPEIQKLLFSPRREIRPDNVLPDEGRQDIFPRYYGSPQQAILPLSGFKTLEQIDHIATNEIKLGHKRTFDTIVTVSDFGKENTLYYPACDRCKKKLIQEGPMWRCRSCTFETLSPNFVFTLQLNLEDHTGNVWAVAFDNVAENIMGIRAKDFRDLLIMRQFKQIEAIRAKVQSKEMKVRLKASFEMYGGSATVRYQIFNAVPVDYQVEIGNLLDTLACYDTL